MKTRFFTSIIFTAVLASSAAQAGAGLSIEETYSGVLPSIARDDDGQGSYYVETMPQLVANIIAATASAAQASTELSIEETYSGVLPNITRNDYGLGSYYVEAKVQPSCTQYDLDPLSIIYPEQRDSVSDYLVPQSAHVVCLRGASHG